jgi:hypothetical protein
MQFHDGANKGTASNFVQISEEMRRRPCNDLTSVQGRKNEPYIKKNPNLPRPKKARQVKSKVKSMLIIFFDIKMIVHRPTVYSTYCCDVLQ